MHLEKSAAIFLSTLPLFAWSQSFNEYYRAQQPQPGTSQEESSEQSEFEAWRRGQQQEYVSYKEQLQKEFIEFKRVLKEEFQNYQRSIGKHWDEVEVSAPKVWVEYSPDRKTKRVVDYDKNEIRIAVIEQKGQNAQAVLESTLKDMLGEEVKTAFQREPVMAKVDQQLKAKSPFVKKAALSRRLVLGELFDKPVPTHEEVAEKAKSLLKSARVAKITVKKFKTERPEQEAMVVTIPLPPDRPLRKAKEYKEMVARHSKKWRINEPLVMAVIHTESAFNPMATSYVPAYGMMQIVPSSGGRDASKELFGEAKLLAPSYLYNADKNVEIGTVYLNLLYYRYFKQINAPESRLYCAIAAYNTGAGNVARAFTGKKKLIPAMRIINRMTPQQVYERLQAHLPHQETRAYLARVSKRIKAYQEL